jgi:hypothetical protein
MLLRRPWMKSIPSFDRMINSVFSYDLSTLYYYFSACHKSYICIEFIINVFRFDGWFMGLSATFNNISAVISWRSVLLVEETVLGEKPPTCRKSLTNFIT